MYWNLIKTLRTYNVKTVMDLSLTLREEGMGDKNNQQVRYKKYRVRDIFIYLNDHKPGILKVNKLIII